MVVVQWLVLFGILYVLVNPDMVVKVPRAVMVVLLVGICILHPLLGVMFAVILLRDPTTETMKTIKRKKSRFEIENTMKRPQDSNEIPTTRASTLPVSLDSSLPTEVVGYQKPKWP
jgi:hypothetical protein